MFRWCVAALVGFAAFAVVPACGQETRVAAAMNLIRALDRPGQINLATVWDGNKYVQCRAMEDRALRCEAAGTMMQPSLEHVLTPEHVGRLLEQGWLFDPHFGNYVRTFAPTTSAELTAREVLAVLTTAYDANLQNIEIETTSVAHEACPPRNGATQNLAGIISDAPAMARFALHACAYTPHDDVPERKLRPNATAADLIAVYGPMVEAEIERLRVNVHRSVFVVFDTGLAYIQCETQSEPEAFYCEAQSADSWPALTAILTPERVAHLHEAGYADPGRAPNYSKIYLADTNTDHAVAVEILTLLYNVYGYYGGTKLAIEAAER